MQWYVDDYESVAVLVFYWWLDQVMLELSGLRDWVLVSKPTLAPSFAISPGTTVETLSYPRLKVKTVMVKVYM